jgi:hypothetical protein
LDIFFVSISLITVIICAAIQQPTAEVKDDEKEDAGKPTDKESKKDKGDFIKLRVIGQV